MAIEIKMPQLGLTMESGTVERWIKKTGDTVKAGEVLLEITTDKLTNEIEAEADGVLLKVTAEEGEEVAVTGTLGYIGRAGEVIEKELSQAAEREPEIPADTVAAQPEEKMKRSDKKLKISPLANRIAKENGIDYTLLEGSGPGGRIVRRDVLSAIQKRQDAGDNLTASLGKAEAIAKKVSSEAVADNDADESADRLKMMEGDQAAVMSGMRRVVAKRMLSSHLEIPPVTQTIKVNVSKLLLLRRNINEDSDIRFSLNDFILKATVKALQAHPQMLVSLDNNQLIQRKHINIGMAVALDEGLIVPVIKDAEQYSLKALSEKAHELTARARNSTLQPDEYKGSTFSLSNLGMFGIKYFTPIINQPDAAILGIGCTEDELIMEEDGAIHKHQVMHLSLTYDHRLLDGAKAAAFQLTLRNLLEHPMDILL